MKNQDLFSSKDKIKKLKCRLLQFLFGAVKGLKIFCGLENEIRITQTISLWLVIYISIQVYTSKSTGSRESFSENIIVNCSSDLEN